MKKPKLYVLHNAAINGTILASTKIEEKILCNKCNMRQQPKRYKEVHYEINYWNGEDVIQGESIFLVSNRLKNALEKANIIGCAFEKAEISKNSFFEMGDMAWSESLPEFWALVVLERYKGPEVWWKKIPCKDCEKEKWNITKAGIISISTPFNTDPVPIRIVFFNSWKGADIFYLEDPDLPIITEKMATILKQFNGDINLLDSGWE